MRKVILAALALSPMLLHAQANSPAPTKTAVAATTLQSKLVSPAIGAAVANTVPANKGIRISTGVTAPKLIYSVSVRADRDSSWNMLSVNKLVVVSMIVDETGTPQDLKIVKSLSAGMDSNVLAAVSQYRFKPGTLNSVPTPIELTLEISLQKGL